MTGSSWCHTTMTHAPASVADRALGPRHLGTGWAPSTLSQLEYVRRKVEAGGIEHTQQGTHGISRMKNQTLSLRRYPQCPVISRNLGTRCPTLRRPTVPPQGRFRVCEA